MLAAPLAQKVVLMQLHTGDDGELKMSAASIEVSLNLCPEVKIGSALGLGFFASLQTN